jgi:hypothetical protein
MVVINQDAVDAPLGLNSLFNLNRAFQIVLSALDLEGRPQWLRDAAAFVISPPERQLKAGDAIGSPNIGTVGCQASWSGGKGFLTAGHVCPTAHRSVYNGRTLLGTVGFASDPTGKGTAIMADVSVVELASGVSFTPTLGSAAPASGRTSVTIATPSAPSDAIIALSSWVYFPLAHCTYGETYLTSNAITAGGDSGSAAVDGNGDVVGMVVGSSAGCTTFIQDAKFQLSEIGKHSTAFPNLTL